MSRHPSELNLAEDVPALNTSLPLGAAVTQHRCCPLCGAVTQASSTATEPSTSAGAV